MQLEALEDWLVNISDSSSLSMNAPPLTGVQHMFLTEQRDDIMKAIIIASRSNIGYDIA